MRKKVFTTFLLLVIGVMVAYYVLKFFYPEKFLLMITDPNILRFGEFLEMHKIFNTVFSVFMSFVTMYLFACSTGGKLYLNWWRTGLILLMSISLKFVMIYAYDFYLHSTIVAMFICACLSNANIYRTTLVYGVHGYLQLFLLDIRGFETILPVMNSAVVYALGLENLLWLILFYIIFNFKKEKKYEL